MGLFIAQEQDTSCFVVALANCLLYLNLPIPDLKSAVKVAGCQFGSTIHHKKVVKFMGAPLRPTKSRKDYREVFQHGGILTIMHPIVNGHAMFVTPIKEPGILCAYNSWLGPPIFNVSGSLLAKFIKPHCNIGVHWVIEK